MRLYEVPNDTMIKVTDDKPLVPPGALEIKTGDELKFIKLDGLYSICYRNYDRVYLQAATEVDIIGPCYSEEAKC